MSLTIKVEQEKEQSVVFLKGEIDIYTVASIERELLPLTKMKGHTVIVNLRDVNYMDSTGLGLFIKALKSATSHESELKLTELQSRIERLFKITGLDELVQIENSTRCH